jgi:predicted PolB exonuclease-like 3'-5' exonuclease
MVDTTSVSAEIRAQRANRAVPGPTTAYLVLDTESVPDGELLRRVKYSDENLTPEEAIARAQAEARELSNASSDFIPVTFHRPVAVCVVRVADDFTLLNAACLDAPQFRTEEIVRQFWRGVAAYPKARLVTFNGRGFDLPLLELAAYDYGCSARDYYASMRNRYQGNQIDLLEWVTNFGAHRMNGGLDNLAKRLHGDNRKRLLDDLDGPPGKKGITGDQVLDMHRAGRLQEINDYCLWDTLDTYFVFLRTRVVLGELTRDEMRLLVRKALEWLEAKAADAPALAKYLSHWKPAEPRLTLLSAEAVELAGEGTPAPTTPESSAPDTSVTVEH